MTTRTRQRLAVIGFILFALGCLGTCVSIAVSAHVLVPLTVIAISTVAMVVGAVVFITYGVLPYDA